MNQSYCNTVALSGGSFELLTVCHKEGGRRKIKGKKRRKKREI
jgi:hypothetical protein